MTLPKFLLFPVIIAALVMLFACEEIVDPVYDENNPDPNPVSDINPVITEIIPPVGHFKEIVSIYGTGFANDPGDNIVLFKNIIGGIVKNTIGEIVYASNTLIQVETPDISNDSLNVVVSTTGSVYFSNEYTYELGSALDTVAVDIPYVKGVAADSAFNVYIGSNSESIIYKIDSYGTKTIFANVAVDGVIEFGPGGELYVCQKSDNKIVKVSQDGLTVSDVVAVSAPLDFDWDVNGDLFIVSEGQGIQVFDGTTLSDTIVSLAAPQNCRIFENFLYVTDDKLILRYDLNGHTVSNPYEIKKMLATAYGLELDANGTIYSTNTRRNRIYQLTDTSTDSTESLEEVLLFVDELLRPVDYLTYFKRGIYATSAESDGTSTVMRGHIGIDAAPNYGRGF